MILTRTLVEVDGIVDSFCLNTAVYIVCHSIRLIDESYNTTMKMWQGWVLLVECCKLLGFALLDG